MAEIEIGSDLLCVPMTPEELLTVGNAYSVVIAPVPIVLPESGYITYPMFEGTPGEWHVVWKYGVSIFIGSFFAPVLGL